jgi:hypothetical protein
MIDGTIGTATPTFRPASAEGLDDAHLGDPTIVDPPRRREIAGRPSRQERSHPALRGRAARSLSRRGRYRARA